MVVYGLCGRDHPLISVIVFGVIFLLGVVISVVADKLDLQCPFCGNWRLRALVVTSFCGRCNQNLDNLKINS